MHNVLIVSNFCAGRKKAIKYKRKIQKFLLVRLVAFRFVDIDQLQNIDMKKFDTILVIGGDGTVNKVLPYLINTDKTLGIIPCGTANLLAERLGINSVSKALKIIDKENSARIDLINVNNRLSILRCGLGFDADIIGKTPQSIKNKFGYLSYLVAGVIFALRLKNKKYIISFDGEEETIDASCIIVANAPNMYKNSFVTANNSKLNDGLFDVFILKTQNPILFFIEILKMMFKIRTDSSVAEYRNANNFKIKNKYCLAHIDGEKIKFTEDLNFGIIKDSINIYCKEDICLERIEILTEDMQRTMVS